MANSEKRLVIILSLYETLLNSIEPHYLKELEKSFAQPSNASKDYPFNLFQKFKYYIGQFFLLGVFFAGLGWLMSQILTQGITQTLLNFKNTIYFIAIAFLTSPGTLISLSVAFISLTAALIVKHFSQKNIELDSQNTLTPEKALTLFKEKTQSIKFEYFNPHFMDNLTFTPEQLAELNSGFDKLKNATLEVMIDEYRVSDNSEIALDEDNIFANVMKRLKVRGELPHDVALVLNNAVADSKQFSDSQHKSYHLVYSNEHRHSPPDSKNKPHSSFKKNS